MQTSQQQYHGSVGQTSYTNPSPDLQQNNANFPPPYHSSYSPDIAQPYSNAHSTVPYSSQQMNSYNPPYRPPMTQDVYNSGQQYGRTSQPHYSSWERESQSFNPIPAPTGSVRNNQAQMPPPHPHFNHQQMGVPSPSHSPRPWPNSVPQHSPRATPSPMGVQGTPSPSLSTRSPGLGKQFSPPPGLQNVNHSFEFSSNQINSSSSSSPSNTQMNVSSVPPQSSATPSVVDSNDPLQSLQKMVMIESQPVESPVERANYEVSSNSSLHSEPAPKCPSDFSNVEQLASNEYADSPGPTYYNLDDGKTVNSKLMCIEETSQGSYGSEHGVGDHFQSVPSMDHMNYSQPMKGIPIDESAPYHPVHQNGYPQPMYPQNPYANNNLIPQKPGRRKQKKHDGNFAEISNPPGKRRKSQQMSPSETYSPNYCPNGMPCDYSNPAYNVPGMMNGPMMMNENSSEVPIVAPKKRAYTKRAKVKKTENNLNTEAVGENVVVYGPKPKRKYSPRRKLSDQMNGKNVLPNIESNCVNGKVSPVSISSFDGPVNITKVPNIISDSSNEFVVNGELIKDEKQCSSPVIMPMSIKTRPTLLKEVSVKIVPLSCSHPERTFINSEILKSENCSETESVSNSICSSTSSIPGISQHSAEEKLINFVDSPVIRKARPRGPISKQKKSKEKIEEKSSEDDKSNDFKKLNDKSRGLSGPYVHIEGSHDNPSLITIINTNVKDEVKKDSKHQQKKVRHITNSFELKRKGGHKSTLSAGYDTLTKDKSWVCVLCHRGSHCDELGDLFGPFCDSSLHIPTSTSLCNDNVQNCNISECDNTSNQRTSSRLRRRRSDDVEPTQSNKDIKQGKSKESTYPNSTIPLTNHITNSGKVSEDESSVLSQSSEKSPDSTKHEFWVHEECISWANGVCIIGQKLIGIEEAVRVAMNMVCTHCGTHGATLGCLAKNCVEKLHYVCAKEKGCILDENSFSVRCPEHKVIHVKERS